MAGLGRGLAVVDSSVLDAVGGFRYGLGTRCCATHWVYGYYFSRPSASLLAYKIFATCFASGIYIYKS